MRSAKDILECVVEGSDGTIGRVHDLFFDDEAWAVRFLVVETDAWLEGRKVLISPLGVVDVDWGKRLIPVAVTRDQVRKSPDVDCHKPVSRQHEVENHAYDGFPPDWGGPGLWGHGSGPRPMLAAHHSALSSGTTSGTTSGTAASTAAGAKQREQAFVDMQSQVRRQRGDDPHLRSIRAMLRYHIHATDGEIGHLAGMIVDEHSWAIEAFVVDTSDWWLGHKVLVKPRSIVDVSWLEATVAVDLSRNAVEHAPAYDPEAMARESLSNQETP